MSNLPVDILDADWRRELGSTRLAGRFALWRENEPALARFNDPQTVIRFLHAQGDPDAKDRVLLALLRCAHGEPLAGRVVLQAMRPALKGLAAWLIAQAVEREEAWSLLMDAAWEQIRTYPTSRRPSRVAANLRLDVLRSVLAQTRSEQDAQRLLPLDSLNLNVEPAAPSRCTPTEEDTDIDGLLARAVSAGAISVAEAELIALTRLESVPVGVLASRERVRPDTLRHRRHRAERRLLLFLGLRVPFGGAKGRSRVARVPGGPSGGSRRQEKRAGQGGERPQPADCRPPRAA